MECLDDECEACELGLGLVFMGAAVGELLVDDAGDLPCGDAAMELRLSFDDAFVGAFT